jgi:hypothetical protein
LGSKSVSTENAEAAFVMIGAVPLAYWYLRLNGFFATANIIVHPDSGTGANQRTDIDVFGIRFPHRAELLFNSMQDDPTILLSSWVPVIVVAEVTTAKCKLNGPWTNPKKQNMQRILRALGAFPSSATDAIANVGRFEDKQYLISLICFGSEQNLELADKYPSVPQLMWTHVKGFIHQRFAQYHREKASPWAMG